MILVKEDIMDAIMLGASTIVVCCVLVLVLALQIQIRTISHKVDEILGKLGEK